MRSWHRYPRSMKSKLVRDVAIGVATNLIAAGIIGLGGIMLGQWHVVVERNNGSQVDAALQLITVLALAVVFVDCWLILLKLFKVDVWVAIPILAVATLAVIVSGQNVWVIFTDPSATLWIWSSVG